MIHLAGTRFKQWGVKIFTCSNVGVSPMKPASSGRLRNCRFGLCFASFSQKGSVSVEVTGNCTVGHLLIGRQKCPQGGNSVLIRAWIHVNGGARHDVSSALSAPVEKLDIRVVYQEHCGSRGWFIKTLNLCSDPLVNPEFLRFSSL